MSETVQFVNRVIYHPPRQSTEILFGSAELILVSDTNRVRNRKMKCKCYCSCLCCVLAESMTADEEAFSELNRKKDERTDWHHYWIRRRQGMRSFLPNVGLKSKCGPARRSNRTSPSIIFIYR
ncbi:hypothetical protein CEXT_755441 [Caerostris extrusa]|uniref:Uncharacterized protein n=1 Tax=Caerostris extrusa TaxID=172846 RepID=A0AAV4MX27_CAEEX|nr:hypothetical protein CEXT_755441 [Caerostris extrusa]